MVTDTSYRLAPLGAGWRSCLTRTGLAAESLTTALATAPLPVDRNVSASGVGAAARPGVMIRSQPAVERAGTRFGPRPRPRMAASPLTPTLTTPFPIDR